MGAQKGKDLLLKLDFDQNGTFETVAGMRSRRIAFGAEPIDVTNADSAGRGRELFFDGAVRTWQVVIPDFGTVSGPFQVIGLEYAGEHDGEVAYEIALESAGALAFAAL